MRRIPWANTLLGLALVFSFGAGFRARASLERMERELSALGEENRNLGIHKDALRKHLNASGFGSPFLTADLAVGSGMSEFLVDDPRDVILYRISTSCPFCSAQYDLLNDLADSGVFVVGLATDTAVGMVEQHAEEWNLRFPILIGPGGTAVDKVPQYGTPTLVVIRGQEVVFLEFGEIVPEVRESLKTLGTGWAMDPTEPLPGSQTEDPKDRFDVILGDSSRAPIGLEPGGMA